MNTNINLPQVFNFYNKDLAEEFCQRISNIIPKIKFDELVIGDADFGETFFVFFTRRDKKYRDIVVEFGGIVDDTNPETETTIVGTTCTSA